MKQSISRRLSLRYCDSKRCQDQEFPIVPNCKNPWLLLIFQSKSPFCLLTNSPKRELLVKNINSVLGVLSDHNPTHHPKVSQNVAICPNAVFLRLHGSHICSNSNSATGSLYKIAPYPSITYMQYLPVEFPSFHFFMFIVPYYGFKQKYDFFFHIEILCSFCKGYFLWSSEGNPWTSIT